MPCALPVPRNRSWAIFGISVLALFLELLLIRWVGTEIRIFAYLQNTVLVVCFLGLGMGAFTSREPARLAHGLVPLFGLVLFMTLPGTQRELAGISERLAAIGDPLIWNAQLDQGGWATLASVGLGLLATLFLMVLVFAAFVPLGRILGRLLDEHPRPIWAYSVNVAGSLLGTWLLVALSWLRLPPAVWFGVVALLALPFLARSRRACALELALLAGILALAPFAGGRGEVLESSWSPYQKLTLRESRPGEVGEYELTVNNVGYQVLIDLSPEHVAAHPMRYPPALRGRSQYDIPARLHPDPERVLIVGAGTGNDAAGALRGGAGHVTAVEIDPVIVELGRRYHPERPYQRPDVEVVVDDARSFFSTSDQRFDLVVFGLLDSHTTTSMTNARLDHYVYTRESLEQARGLLAEGGILVMTFDAQRLFIADRMARTLSEVFGGPPLSFAIPPSAYGWGGIMFVAGDLARVRAQLAANPRLAAWIRRWQRTQPLQLSYTTPLATDDWPYLYLPKRRIPVLYVLLAGLMAALFALGARVTGCRGLLVGWRRPHWHFFCLGTAFLLLEVQNISKAALALGNTWWVNSVIISGVLAMVLLANAVAHRFPRLPLPPVYACLLGSCVALFFFDLASLASLTYGVKAFVVGTLTTLPMFFAGIVFIRSFAVTPRKDEALGANLVGALLGGLLQSLTFLTGVKALLLVVAAFYALVFLTRPRALRGELAAGSPRAPAV